MEFCFIFSTLQSSRGTNTVAMYLTVVILAACVSGSTVCGKSVPCPKQYCHCVRSDGKATCTSHGKRLSYIPQLPGYVRALWFTNNHLPNIDRNTFKNLATLRLEEIHLAENRIMNISRDAFEDLIYLKTLDIGGNRHVDRSQLSMSFSSVSEFTIEKLVLANNQWKSLRHAMFQHFRGSTLSSIHLDKNKLAYFDFDEIYGIDSLNEISLEHNQLRFINGSKILKNITKLLLDYNSLYYNNSTSIFNFPCIFPKLLFLSMERNYLRTFSKKFECLSSLQVLRLDSNSVDFLPDNLFSHMTQLQRLSLKQIGPYLNRLSKFSLNVSSLERLYLANNRMHLGAPTFTYSPANIFKFCRRVNFLDMTANDMSKVSRINLGKMFSPLYSTLESLILHTVRLRYLPNDFFGKFAKLKKLVLSNNGLISWNGEAVFAKMLTLQQLFLDSNHISIVNETSLPRSIIKTLQKLTLSANPFACTCDLLWFQKFLQSHVNTIDIPGYPTAYTCFGKKDQLLRDYDIMCGNPLAIVAISVSSVVGILLIAILVIYKTRWHLRYWIYLLRTRKKDYTKLLSDDMYEYDGYVIYCDDDQKWVHEDLLPGIEDVEGFKLCIRLRDFIPGRVIVENIAENMEKSRRIMLILSGNFVTDEWCQFEMLLAQTRLIEEGRDLMVLVMLEELDSRHVSKSLHALVTTTPYSTWCSTETGRKLFFGEVTDCLKSDKRLPGQYGSINA